MGHYLENDNLITIEQCISMCNDHHFKWFYFKLLTRVGSGTRGNCGCCHDPPEERSLALAHVPTNIYRLDKGMNQFFK